MEEPDPTGDPDLDEALFASYEQAKEDKKKHAWQREQRRVQRKAQRLGKTKLEVEEMEQAKGAKKTLKQLDKDRKAIDRANKKQEKKDKKKAAKKAERLKQQQEGKEKVQSAEQSVFSSLYGGYDDVLKEQDRDLQSQIAASRKEKRLKQQQGGALPLLNDAEDFLEKEFGGGGGGSSSSAANKDVGSLGDFISYKREDGKLEKQMKNPFFKYMSSKESSGGGASLGGKFASNDRFLSMSVSGDELKKPISDNEDVDVFGNPINRSDGENFHSAEEGEPEEDENEVLDPVECSTAFENFLNGGGDLDSAEGKRIWNRFQKSQNPPPPKPKEPEPVNRQEPQKAVSDSEETSDSEVVNRAEQLKSMSEQNALNNLNNQGASSSSSAAASKKQLPQKQKSNDSIHDTSSDEAQDKGVKKEVSLGGASKQRDIIMLDSSDEEVEQSGNGRGSSNPALAAPNQDGVNRQQPSRRSVSKGSRRSLSKGSVEEELGENWCRFEGGEDDMLGPLLRGLDEKYLEDTQYFALKYKNGSRPAQTPIPGYPADPRRKRMELNAIDFMNSITSYEINHNLAGGREQFNNLCNNGLTRRLNPTLPKVRDDQGQVDAAGTIGSKLPEFYRFLPDSRKKKRSKVETYKTIDGGADGDNRHRKLVQNPNKPLPQSSLDKIRFPPDTYSSEDEEDSEGPFTNGRTRTNVKQEPEVEFVRAKPSKEELRRVAQDAQNGVGMDENLAKIRIENQRRMQEEENRPNLRTVDATTTRGAGDLISMLNASQAAGASLGVDTRLPSERDPPPAPPPVSTTGATRSDPVALRALGHQDPREEERKRKEAEDKKRQQEQKSSKKTVRQPQFMSALAKGYSGSNQQGPNMRTTLLGTSSSTPAASSSNDGGATGGLGLKLDFSDLGDLPQLPSQAPLPGDPMSLGNPFATLNKKKREEKKPQFVTIDSQERRRLESAPMAGMSRMKEENKIFVEKPKVWIGIGEKPVEIDNKTGVSSNPSPFNSNPGSQDNNLNQSRLSNPKRKPGGQFSSAASTVGKKAPGGQFGASQNTHMSMISSQLDTSVNMNVTQLVDMNSTQVVDMSVDLGGGNPVNTNTTLPFANDINFDMSSVQGSSPMGVNPSQGMAFNNFQPQQNQFQQQPMGMQNQMGMGVNGLQSSPQMMGNNIPMNPNMSMNGGMMSTQMDPMMGMQNNSGMMPNQMGIQQQPQMGMGMQQSPMIQQQPQQPSGPMDLVSTAPQSLITGMKNPLDYVNGGLAPLNGIGKLKVKTALKKLRDSCTTQPTEQDFRRAVNEYLSAVQYVRLDQLLEGGSCSGQKGVNAFHSGRSLLQEIAIRGLLGHYKALETGLGQKPQLKDIFPLLHHDRTHTTNLSLPMLAILGCFPPKNGLFGAVDEAREERGTQLVIELCKHTPKELLMEKISLDTILQCTQPVPNLVPESVKSLQGIGSVSFSFKDILQLKQKEGSISLLSANWIKTELGLN